VFSIIDNPLGYLISPDAWMVMYVFNKGLPLWLCFFIPVVHSVAWMAVKTYFFRKVTVLAQKRAQYRKYHLSVHPSRSTWLRQLWRYCKHLANRAYHRGCKIARNKPVTPRMFFWLGLEPQCQKAGCGILGIFWPRFGWRGFLDLCLGGVCQVTCFTLLYMFCGNDIANIIMYCIFVPLGFFALYRWTRRNGANHTK
jgi:hypothetical protein